MVWQCIWRSVIASAILFTILGAPVPGITGNRIIRLSVMSGLGLAAAWWSAKNATAPAEGSLRGAVAAMLTWGLTAVWLQSHLLFETQTPIDSLRWIFPTLLKGMASAALPCGVGAVIFGAYLGHQNEQPDDDDSTA